MLILFILLKSLSVVLVRATHWVRENVRERENAPRKPSTPIFAGKALFFLP